MKRETFINLNLNGPLVGKLLLRHLVYSFIWILGIGVLFFRIDLKILEIIPKNYYWINQIIPIVFCAAIIIFMFKSKWYYNLSFIFYPILISLWFLPKAILKNGKIYLLFGYINFLFNRIKRYKATIIHSILIIIISILLLASNSTTIKIIGLLYFSFLYYLIVIKYIRQSLHPVKLFGINFEKKIDELINKPEKSYILVNSIADVNHDEKLNEEEKKLKKVERLIIIKSIIEHFSTNLNGFRGKRALIISWVFQILGFVAISIVYFTFLNYELFLINNSNFLTTLDPGVFDFFYYTAKTFIFSNIEAIVPISILAKIIEIISFLTVGVFIFIIVTSIIFSLRQEKVNDNIKKATEFCAVQNNFITKQVEIQYQMDIESVLLDMKTIKKSVDNIKKVIEKIL